MISPRVIEEILAGYSLPPLGIHGIAHWGRVLETGLKLAQSTGADPAVVTLFAVFHDARRINEGTDPGHGRRGADLATSLRPLLGLTDAQFDQLTHACAHHTDGTTVGDATVQTCWDSDRLDLWRVGMTPHDPWLCTEAAREAEIREWTRIRSLDDYLPECAAAWLCSKGRSN
ncbi:MAG: hypothetical protein QGI43_01090 [Gemmatimonadota bacterium]|nr:hypothetical protein [Gemmatimonadota bacterium]